MYQNKGKKKNKIFYIPIQKVYKISWCIFCTLKKKNEKKSKCIFVKS